MAEDRTVHVLEGLGYCAAVLIGVAGLGTNPALRLFHVAGLIIALVVVVRLLALNASKAAAARGGAAEMKLASDSDDAEAREEVTR